MNIELQGMTEMIAKLRKIQLQTSGPEMQKAVRAGGRVIRDAMKVSAPVLDARTTSSTALEPGALKAGIRSFAPKGETPFTVLIGPSAKVEHVGRWIEYGHRQVSGGYSKVLANGSLRGPGKVIGFVPAYPFLRSAFESSRGAAEAAIVASIKASIEEQMR